MTNTRGSRRISSRRARFRASRYVMTAMALVLVHVGEQLFGRRLGRSLGERHRLVHLIRHRLLDQLEIGLGEGAVLQTALREEDDRIALLLPLDLFLGPVDGARGIAHRVPAEAIGARLDEGGHLLPSRAL